MPKSGIKHLRKRLVNRDRKGELLMRGRVTDDWEPPEAEKEARNKRKGPYRRRDRKGA